MKKEIVKLYNGNVDVNSLLVEKCIREKEPLEIIHDGDSMKLSVEDLISKRVVVSKTFKSKISNTPDYKLYSYEWNPDKIEL